jgi:protein phosphatase
MVSMEYLVARTATPARRAGSASAIGRRRDRNEDASLCGPSWFAVADGVGGRSGGDLASRITVDVLAERQVPGEVDGIAAALEQINGAIRERARASAMSGMASTVAGLVMMQGSPVVFHVGDSRCYHLVDGRFDLLTRDHSYVRDLVDAGRISAAEAEHHRYRNIITRALGADAVVCPDVRTITRPFGRLLLCTDGVSSVTTPGEIARVLAGHADPQRAAERLVETAVDNGTDDDATAVVVDLDDGQSCTLGDA